MASVSDIARSPKLYMFAQAVVVACLGFIAATLGRRMMVEIDSSSMEPMAAGRSSLESGSQLWIYFMGGSGCASCRSPEIKSALLQLRRALDASPPDGFSRVHIIGTAINTSQTMGLEYLSALGDSLFDEVSAGGGWQGESMLQLARSFSIRTTLPKVIVLVRPTEVLRSPTRIRVGQDSLLGVLTGRAAILGWAASGFDLDSLPP